MRKIVIVTALLLGASPAFAQAPPEMPSSTPPQPSPLVEQPKPLETLQGLAATSQAFEVYYNNMVKESVNFGAQPRYSCTTSIDGSKLCHNYTMFTYNGFAVSLTDIFWANGRRNHSVCLSKPFDTTKICARNDGELWTQDAGIMTKIYRQRR
jgi:hypothetical protein